MFQVKYKLLSLLAFQPGIILFATGQQMLMEEASVGIRVRLI